MIALGVAILAIFAATLFNNLRITDLRESVNQQLNAFRESVNQHIDDKYALLDAKLDRIIDLLAGHDERITRLERQRGG